MRSPKIKYQGTHCFCSLGCLAQRGTGMAETRCLKLAWAAQHTPISKLNKMREEKPEVHALISRPCLVRIPFPVAVSTELLN